MRNQLIGTMLVLCSVATAANDFVVNPQSSGGQAIRWVDGFATVEDSKPLSKVVLSGRAAELPGDPSSFVIVVFNTSDEPITFGPENVRMEFPGGEQISMSSPQQMEDKHRRDIKRRKAFAAIGGAFSAGSANGYTSGTYTYSGTTTGGGYVSGSGTYSGNDPALAQQQQQAAQQQAQGVNRAIEARNEEGNEALSYLLRKTTVDPGRAQGGVLAFEVPRSAKRKPSIPVSIMITVGTEEHRFSGTLSKSQ